MSKALLEKLLRSRESGVVVDGHTFTIRRPTDEDALTLQGSGPLDFVKRFVVGWDLTELDIIPGGGPERVPFSTELWSAYVSDHPELWEPLATPIVEAYRTHAVGREEAEKN